MRSYHCKTALILLVGIRGTSNSQTLVVLQRFLRATARQIWSKKKQKTASFFRFQKVRRPLTSWSNARCLLARYLTDVISTPHKLQNQETSDVKRYITWEPPSIGGFRKDFWQDTCKDNLCRRSLLRQSGLPWSVYLLMFKVVVIQRLNGCSL